jgi:putative ABC transport system substrate-binding protein
MNRRAALLALIALGTPSVASVVRAGAQGRLPKVGYLFSFAPAEGEHYWQACRQGLRELGYVEGKNILLEPRWTDGHYDRLPALVQNLLRLKVDIIVVAATPGSQAVKAATSTTPIVFVAVADPVRAGLAGSLAKPGGNATGLTLLTPELSGRRLKILADLVRRTPRVATLSNPANRSHDIFLEETLAAARQLAIQIEPMQAREPADIEQAFAATAARHADAMLVFDDPVLWNHRRQIVGLAAKLRLPVMYGYREFIDEGGLVSYGPKREDLYRRTAGYVDRILKGARPADLPIERPTKFELVINRAAAKALHIDIPQSVLVLADELIE